MAIVRTTNPAVTTQPAGNIVVHDGPPFARYAVIPKEALQFSRDGMVWTECSTFGVIVVDLWQSEVGYITHPGQAKVFTQADCAVKWLPAGCNANGGDYLDETGGASALAEGAITSLGVFSIDSDNWAVSGNLWSIDKNPAATTAPWDHVSGGTWEVNRDERIRAIVARVTLDDGASGTRGILEGEAQLMALNADADPLSSPSLGEDFTPMQHFDAENNGGGVFGMDRFVLVWDLTLGEEAALKAILASYGDDGIQPWFSDLQFASPAPTEAAGQFTLTCELFQVS